MKTYRVSCDTCGWTSNPCRSQNQAEFAHRLHSCERWQAKAAAAQRGRARKAAVDRTPKPCTHKRTTHVHGTHACYVLDRCRCHPCSAANTAYERDRIRQQAYGRWNNMVDAEPAREHVRALQAQGMGLKQIVAATNGEFSQGAMTRLMYGRNKSETNRQDGPSRRIAKDHAEALLAVHATLHTLAGGAKIDGTGTRRRLQALVCLGWSQSRLAVELGYSQRNFNHLVQGKRGVTVRNAIATRNLYDRLWNVAPVAVRRGELAGINRSKRYAAQHGWAPPLAWDDDQIDDPKARPHASSRVPITNRLDADAMADNVRFLLQQDPWATSKQIAHRLGYRTNEAVLTALRRAGHSDLIEQFTRNAQVAS